MTLLLLACSNISALLSQGCFPSLSSSAGARFASLQYLLPR